MLQDIALYRVLSHFMNDGMHYKYQSFIKGIGSYILMELYISMLHYKKNDKKYRIREKHQGWGDYIRKANMKPL